MHVRFIPFTVALATSIACSSAAAGYGTTASAGASVYVISADGEETVLSPEPTYIAAGDQGISSATATHGITFGGFSLSATSTADLATGTLRGYASASLASGGVAAWGSAAHFESMNDSFKITNPAGGVFTWLPNSTVSFSLHLDGSSFNSFSQGGIPWMVGIQLYAPGTFDGGDPLSTGSAIWTSFIDTPGDNTERIQQLINAGSAAPSNVTWSGNATSGYDLLATFAPAGDFDWRIYMIGNATVDVPGTSSVSDYAHTLSVSYTGPVGSVTESASGLFPGTIVSSVPEPETYALMLAGLGVLGFVGRCRRAG